MHRYPLWRRLPTLAALAALTPALAPAQTAAPADTFEEDDEDLVVLDIFTVSTEGDYGYASLNTTQGTRTNEALRDIPSPISVLNSEFLADIAATDLFAAVNFSLGAELANQGGVGVAGDASSGNNVIFRGIQNNWQSRDGFQWYVPSDNFNTERVESNRGPTGQLFGDAAATGILNITSKQARPRRSFARWDVRVDSNDSLRTTIDVNTVLGKGHAVRFNAVASDLGSWQDTGFNKTTAWAVASQHRFLKDRLTVRLNFEKGEIDRIQLTGLQTDGFAAYVPGTGSTQDTSTAGGLQNPFGTTNIANMGNAQRWTIIDGVRYNLESTGPTSGGGSGRYYRQSAAPPNVSISEDIVPREQQWNGPSNRFDRDYYVFTASADYKIGDRLYFEVAYNHQYQVGTNFQTNMFNVVRRDPNPFLPDPSGTGEIANPNYDKLYVEHIYRQQKIRNRVDNLRAMAVYDLVLPESIRGLIGRQRFVATAAYRDDRFSLINSELDLTAEAIAATGATGAAAQFRNNALTYRYYLENGNGDNIAYRPRDDAAFVSSVPANTQATNPRLKSYTANVFGAFFKDSVRTSVGLRRDFFEQDNVPLVTDATTGLVSFAQTPDGELAYAPLSRLDNTALNYGAVWHGLRWVSLFANYAETFQFNQTGTYFNGDQRLPRFGDGLDYGVRFSLFRDTVNLAVTLFDNTSQNGTLNAVNNQQTADEINNLLSPVDRIYTTGNDTLDTNSTGYEAELVANPTRNWTLRVTVSNYDRKDTNFAPRLNSVLEQMRAVATDPSQYALTEARVQTLQLENPRTRTLPTVATRYNFRDGFLKGLAIGGSAYMRKVDLTTGSEEYWLTNLLVSYGRPFMKGKLRWRTQFNVENLFDVDQQLTNPPQSSFLAPRLFILTSTIEF